MNQPRDFTGYAVRMADPQTEFWASHPEVGELASLHEGLEEAVVVREVMAERHPDQLVGVIAVKRGHRRRLSREDYGRYSRTVDRIRRGREGWPESAEAVGEPA